MLELPCSTKWKLFSLKKNSVVILIELCLPYIVKVGTETSLYSVRSGVVLKYEHCTCISLGARRIYYSRSANPLTNQTWHQPRMIASLKFNQFRRRRQLSVLISSLGQIIYVGNCCMYPIPWRAVEPSCDPLYNDPTHVCVAHAHIVL